MSVSSSPGPQPISRSDRRAIVDEIVMVVRERFSDKLVALGMYGSTGRGTDLPYSDIEMHCVVKGTGIDQRYEWAAGAWKAEVDVLSQDIILREAAGLEGTWPLTHGAFTHVLPLAGDLEFFALVRDAALNHSDAEFDYVMHDLVVGEIYELVAKLRNCRANNGGLAVSMYATELAMYAACLVGLANRHLFSTGSLMFTESLGLPNRPNGYDDLCALLVEPGIVDVNHVGDVADCFWEGVEVWAASCGVKLYEETSHALGRPLQGVD